MTTISTIIDDAFRESNLTGVGRSPTTAEQTEALSLLNRVVYSMYADEAGEALTDLPYGKNNVSTTDFLGRTFDDFDTDFVPDNTRLVLNLQETKTINLPPKPRDGARFSIVDASGNLATYPLIVNGNGRLIEAGTSKTLNTNGQTRSWFYRADASDWKAVSDLITTDASPFPTEFDDLLVIKLALRINPRYGVQLDQQTLQRYAEMMRKFRARYAQITEVPVEMTLRRIGAWKQIGFSSTDAFNRGEI